MPIPVYNLLDIPSDEVLAAKIRYIKRTRPLDLENFHDIQWQLLRDRAEITVAMGGNRSAKSGWLCRAIAGIVSHTYPIPGMYPDTPVHWRHISHSDLLRDMIQPLIEQMLPRDWIVRRKAYPGGGFDEMWWFKDGGFLSFVTREQDPADMAGVELHGFSHDEPVSQPVWSENWRRLSAPWRKVLVGMTPWLSASWFIDEYVTSPKPNCSVISMPIWANCECLAGLEPEKLRRLGKPVSLSTAKHAGGAQRDALGCRCNHGFISQEILMTYLAGVASWELEAAEWGTPLFLQRRIYPEYANDSFNTFDPDRIQDWHGVGRLRHPKDGTLWVCLDPADGRPDAIMFVAVTPDNRRWTLRELPDYREGQWRGHYLDQMKTGRSAPSETIKLIARVVTELGMRDRMGGFMGFDPHYTHYSYDAANKAVDIVEQYNQAIKQVAEWLPRFKRVDPHKDGNREIPAGHKAVAEWFLCDKSKPFDPILNAPRWRDSIYCDNVIRSSINYRRCEDPKDEEKGISDTPAKAFKDFNDVRRYEDAMKIRYMPEVVPSRDSGGSYTSAAA